MSASGMNRKQFIRTGALAGALLPLAGMAGCLPGASRAKVVVIGGGFAGATAAKYIRRWDPAIEVTMIERNPSFISCPMSNLVITHNREITQIEHDYSRLADHGVNVVRGDVTAVYTDNRTVRLSDGSEFAYDRLVMSPGIDFTFDEIPGCEAAVDGGEIFHAWRPGAQTLGLREQLAAMPEDGVFIMTIPQMPYRCPPGPYERVCLVADYFTKHKPNAKLLVFDGNPDVVSKGALFKRAWAEFYPGMIDYIPGTRPTDVRGSDRTVIIDGQAIRGDVLNVIPPQRAGEIASRAGLVTDGRWCGVDWRSCESIAVPNVHVLGDATANAPNMPKSGHMANAHAKVCAAAIVNLLNDQAPDPDPVFTNTCFSYLNSDDAVHVASVHRWDAERSTVMPLAEANGLSDVPSQLEGQHAWAWAQNIWNDMLA